MPPSAWTSAASPPSRGPTIAISATASRLRSSKIKWRLLSKRLNSTSCSMKGFLIWARSSTWGLPLRSLKKRERGSATKTAASAREERSPAKSSKTILNSQKRLKLQSLNLANSRAFFLKRRRPKTPSPFNSTCHFLGAPASSICSRTFGLWLNLRGHAKNRDEFFERGGPDGEFFGPFPKEFQLFFKERPGALSP